MTALDDPGKQFLSLRLSPGHSCCCHVVAKVDLQKEWAGVIELGKYIVFMIACVGPSWGRLVGRPRKGIAG